MAFFKGEFESKLDSKGRMVLPARLKGKMPKRDEGQLVIQKAPKEKCLFVQPLSAWERKMQRVNALNEFRGAHRKLQRKLMSVSSDSELDGNGRFLIPKAMLEWAGLEKEVVVVGVGDRIELWSRPNYDAFMEGEGEEDLDSLAEAILGEESDEA